MANQTGARIVVMDPVVWKDSPRFDRAPKFAPGLAEGLRLQTGDSLSRNAMVDLPIPAPASLKSWQQTVANFDAQNYEQSLEGTLDKLDRIIAKAFKVPAEEVAFVKSAFQADPVLRRVRPNLPVTDRRLVGLCKGLAASERYEKAYRTRH
jgi:hypothetical protein